MALKDITQTIRINALTKNAVKNINDVKIAVNQLPASTKQSSDSVSKLAKSFTTVTAAIATVMITAKQLSLAIKSSIEAQKTYNKLIGQFGSGFAARLNDVAGELQAITTYDDDIIKSSLSMAKAFNSAFDPNTAKLYSKTIIGIATIYLKDLVLVSEAYSKAMNGNTRSLKSLLGMQGSAATAQLLLNIALLKGAQGFHTATEYAKTNAGQILQLRNKWGDFQLLIGNTGIAAVVAFDKIISGSNDAADSFSATAAVINSVIAGIILTVQGIGSVLALVLKSSYEFAKLNISLMGLMLTTMVAQWIDWGRNVINNATVVGRAIWKALTFNINGAILLLQNLLMPTFAVTGNGINRLGQLITGFANTASSDIQTVVDGLRTTWNIFTRADNDISMPRLGGGGEESEQPESPESPGRTSTPRSFSMGTLLEDYDTDVQKLERMVDNVVQLKGMFESSMMNINDLRFELYTDYNTNDEVLLSLIDTIASLTNAYNDLQNSLNLAIISYNELTDEQKLAAADRLAEIDQLKKSIAAKKIYVDTLKSLKEKKEALIKLNENIQSQYLDYLQLQERIATQNVELATTEEDKKIAQEIVAGSIQAQILAYLLLLPLLESTSIEYAIIIEKINELKLKLLAKPLDSKFSWINKLQDIVSPITSAFDSLGTAIGNTLVKGANFGRLMKDVWTNMTASILANLSAMIAKMLTMLAIQGLLSAFGLSFTKSAPIVGQLFGFSDWGNLFPSGGNKSTHRYNPSTVDIIPNNNGVLSRKLDRIGNLILNWQPVQTQVIDLPTLGKSATLGNAMVIGTA